MPISYDIAIESPNENLKISCLPGNQSKEDIFYEDSNSFDGGVSEFQLDGNEDMEKIDFDALPEVNVLYQMHNEIELANLKSSLPFNNELRTNPPSNRSSYYLSTPLDSSRIDHPSPFDSYHRPGEILNPIEDIEETISVV